MKRHSQLSEPVREHLKTRRFSRRRQSQALPGEIRGLEERITYLRAEDLAAAGESHEQAEQELTLQADALQEIAELEQRQFSGMDVSAMQERLVELSGRYEKL